MLTAALVVVALFSVTLAFPGQTVVNFKTGTGNQQCAIDSTMNTKNCYYSGTCYTTCIRQPRSSNCQWQFAYPESGKALHFKCTGNRLINGIVFHRERWDINCCDFPQSTVTNCGTDRVNAPWDLTLQSIDVNSAWNHFVFRGCRVQ